MPQAAGQEEYAPGDYQPEDQWLDQEPRYGLKPRSPQRQPAVLQSMICRHCVDPLGREIEVPHTWPNTQTPAGLAPDRVAATSTVNFQPGQQLSRARRRGIRHGC